jgi:hypothetical protein
MAIIQNSDGGWAVVSCGVVLASFRTNAEAWRYVDRCNGEHVSPSERRSDYGWDNRCP